MEKYQNFLIKSGTKIYIRSIFLQGSLLKRVNHIKKLTSIYKRVEINSKKTKQTNYENCLNFVLSNKFIDKIIVGVRNIREFKKLINHKYKIKPNNINFSKNEKIFAYKPSLWKNLNFRNKK